MAKASKKGAAKQSVRGPDMSRNKDLAGMSVRQGDHTVTYDELGYAPVAKHDGGASATHRVPTTHANDSSYHQEAYKAAQAGNWDQVGRIMNGYSEEYGQTGEPGVLNLKPANDYIAELQNEFGYNAEGYYNDRYDKAYGNGSAAAYDATGGSIKSYSQLVNAVGAEKAQEIINAQMATNPSVYQGKWSATVPAGTAGAGAMGMTGAQGSLQTGMQTSANPYGQYGSFDDFLADMGYSDYADATKKAIRAAVQQAISGYNQQIEDTNEDSEELARQAYINMMMGGKNLDQQLAASGYAGGMADSQRIAMQANYENDLNALERQRAATVAELQRAITNAQLTGDMQTAQELASYLQQVQGQWNNYVMNQQAMANENYWRQQSIDADNQNRAREMALMIIQSGNMPDDETLSAAGISRAQAQALLGTTGQTLQTGTPVRTGGGYNNGSLTSQQVKELQYALGVAQDGLWGNNSSNAAAAAMGINGTVSADDAWAYYQQGQQEPVTEEYAKTASAQRFGTNYSTVLNQVRNMKNSGANEKAIQAYLDQFNNQQLTDAGLDRILTLLNIGGYRAFSGFGGV
jgi:hypothetical protein